MTRQLPLSDARGVAASVLYSTGFERARSALRSLNRRLVRPGYMVERRQAVLRGVALVVELEVKIPVREPGEEVVREEPRLLGVFPSSRQDDLYDLLSAGDKTTLSSLLKGAI